MKAAAAIAPAAWAERVMNARRDTVSPSNPDLSKTGRETTQTNLIFPSPTRFRRADLPVCSVIRPAPDKFAGAVATIESFTADRLFAGQSAKCLRTVMRLAGKDAAQ